VSRLVSAAIVVVTATLGGCAMVLDLSDYKDPVSDAAVADGCPANLPTLCSRAFGSSSASTVCSDLNSDGTNCGGCGHFCDPSKPLCVDGVCTKRH
jgi:hypothetical protein